MDTRRSILQYLQILTPVQVLCGLRIDSGYCAKQE
jgi:hypothetical protein